MVKHNTQGTILKAVAALAVVFVCVLSVVAQAQDVSLRAGVQTQDFSRSYRYGGPIRLPGASGLGGGIQRDIVNVNAGIDVGGVLGCSGIDLRSMIQNTFEIGDLAGEFKDYLKNTLATEALSLLYSQPGVSQVLDGLKAVGHARASILQERCNANEILADVTNQRLRSEAQELCLQERSPTECEGETLGGYVEQITASSRWSGTLHDHICPADSETGERSASCRFIPNFAYDVGTRSGNRQPASYSDRQVRADARNAALECLQERGERASEIVDEEGYARALEKIASGERKVYCGEGLGGGVGGADTGVGGGSVAGSEDPVAAAIAGLSPAESCIMMGPDDPEDDSDGPITINVQDLDQAIEQAGNLDLRDLVDAHIKCIIGQELHGHVDLNIVSAPAVEALAAWNGLAEVFATKAFLNLNAMRMHRLTQAILNSGGRDSAKTCSPEEEETGTCRSSMNPQTLDSATVMLQQFRDEQEAALVELQLAEQVANRIKAVTDERDARGLRAQAGVASQASRGGASAARADANVDYTDFFQ